MRRLVPVAMAILLVGCGTSTPALAPAPTEPSRPTRVPTATAAMPTSPAVEEARTATPAPMATARASRDPFPSALFSDLPDSPMSDDLAAELQDVLDARANGVGVTAALITPLGIWNGATGMATAERAMVPDDQMSIASITKTVVAAQIMQLVEAGRLRLDDLAADRLPRGLEFDTNGATIENLLSMRSGIAEYFADEDDLVEALTTDPLHAWTVGEKLATVAPDRGEVGQDWAYIGTNYLLLGLIVEEVAGRSVAAVLRDGVLAGEGYERLIYQPDERPSDPMALPNAAPEDAFDDGGGYLPSINNATMFTSEGAMASDALSLARWFGALCAGRVVSPASLDDMTDFIRRPEYGLGIWDRRPEYGAASAALGHTGLAREGYRSAALCFQEPASAVVVLANSAEEHDVDSTAGRLWQVVSNAVSTV